MTRLTALLATLVLPAAGTAQELVSNGSFEGTYVAGVAPGWSNFTIDTRAESVFAESASGRTGKAQLVEVTTILGGWYGGGPALAAPINSAGTPAGLVAGADYEVTAWLRTDRQQLHKVTLAVDDARAWQPNPYARIPVAVGPEWKKATLRFRASSSDTSANVALYLRQEGKLWVDDVSVRRLQPTDRAPAPAGNLLRNGSFEVGTLGWQNRYTTSSLLADATAPDGPTALSLSWYGIPSSRLTSTAFALPWGHSYTVSLHLRATSLGTAASTPVHVWVASGATSFGDAASAIATATFDVTASWARYSFTFVAPPVPGESAALIIDPPDGPGLIIDAVQVEAGSVATAFAPRFPVEAGLELEAGPSWKGAYAENAPIQARLRVYNSSPQRFTRALRKRLRDLWDNPVPGSEGSEAVDLAPRSTESRLLTFTAGARLGAFRAEVDIDDALSQPAADATFAVLPPPPGAATQAPIGTHLDFDSETTHPRTAGAGWTKTWYTTWDKAEPVDGTWTYATASSYLNRWSSAGLHTLAVVGSPPIFEQDRPASGAVTFAGSWYPPRSLVSATDYATRIATQLGDRIRAWELGNEPDVFLYTPSGTTRYQAYPPEAHAYAVGIRQARPTAKILVGSATTDRSPEEWIANALAQSPADSAGRTLRDLVTGVSFHNYDPDPATTRRIVQRLRAKLQELASTFNAPHLEQLELWDTEWAPADTLAPFSRHRPRLAATSETHPDARRGAALVARGLVTRLGEGVANNFLYQAYGPGDVLQGGYDLPYEMDGTPRPVMPAMAVVARELAEASQPVALESPGVWGYRFLRADRRPLYVLWADEREAAGHATFPAPVRVTASDMMGNPYGAGTYATGSVVPVPAEPIYLLGPATELEVSYGPVVIADGDSTPTTLEGTAFGATEANHPPLAVTRTFTVRNLTAATITLHGPIVSGSEAGDFIPVAGLPPSLAAGASVEFSVRFLPAGLGARAANVQLVSSVGTVSFAVAGTGTVARPVLEAASGSIVAQGRIGAGGVDVGLVLSNRGRGPLEWSASVPALYTVSDSTQAGGPLFDWIGPRAGEPPPSTGLIAFGTSSSTSDRDDLMSGPVDIGFPFPFFGAPSTTVRVSTNGVITFDGSVNVPFANTTLPQASAPAKSIFVLWDDLYLLGTVSQAYVVRPNPDTCVITWYNVAYFGDRNARQTFQVILSRDGTIQCQYATVARSPNNAGFVIGLQNANSADQALLYSRTPNPPANSLAVRFRPPPQRLSTQLNLSPGNPASWLTLRGTTQGTVPGLSQGEVGLRFEPLGLTPGQTYRTVLNLTTNDPAAATVTVPVTFEVLPTLPLPLPATGLVAHWSFDEPAGTVATDLTDSGRDASWAPGAASRDPAGVHASALRFGGATSSGASFSAPEIGPMTFSGWVRLAGEGGTSSARYPRVLALPGVQLLLRRASADGTYGSIGLNSLRSGGGATGDWRSSAGLLALNAWYHVAVTFDPSSPGNTPVFYLNGNRLETTTITAPGGTQLSNAGPGWLGNRADGQRPLDGWLDQVRLYQRVLSADEIVALLADPGAPLAPASLVAEPGSEGIVLTWPATAGPEATYSVWRALDGSPIYAEIAAGAGWTRHLDTGLSPGATASYFVRAVRYQAAGPRSPTVLATALTRPEAWLLRHFGSTTASGAAQPGEDPDGDGRVNALEYALGQLPRHPETDPGIRYEHVGGRLRLRFNRGADPATLYRVTASADLVHWSEVWRSSGAANVAGEVIVTDDAPAGSGLRFLRLEVSTY